MTVQAGVLRSDYIGNGSTRDFAIGYQILDRTHIDVYLTDPTDLYNPVKQVLDTDYTVPGDLDSGAGWVNFTVAPTKGFYISIIRSVPLNQLTDYEQYGDFPAESHERALDKLTMITQQQAEELNRCVKIPVSSESSYEFPLPASGQVIQWDIGATKLINGPTAGEISSAQSYAIAASASASAAATSETNAATSETNAGISASAAAVSETNAANSAAEAGISATSASNSASAALVSETNAATSEANAAASASLASTSETNAANSASAAATSATSASDSADVAGGYKDLAFGYASNAFDSQVAAAGSASAAAISAQEAGEFLFSYDWWSTSIVGSSTWTVPTGVTAIEGLAVGGGGAGGGMEITSGGLFGAAGGGGSGAAVWFRLTGLTPGAVISYTIGGGGAGVNANVGGPGGSTGFGGWISAEGGKGGRPSKGWTGDNLGWQGVGGNGGSYTIASSGGVSAAAKLVVTNIGGIAGFLDAAGTALISGMGAPSAIAIGGSGVFTTGPGGAGSYGSGGGGAFAYDDPAQQPGGAGGGGYLVLWYKGV